MQSVSAEKSLLILYRQDLQVFIVRWLRSASSEQLFSGYRQILSEASALQPNYWLLDLRSRGPVSKEDEITLIQDFFPQVESSIPGTHYFAYLVTPTHYEHIDRTLGIDKISEMSERIRIRPFDAESAALQWLTQAQQSSN